MYYLAMNFEVNMYYYYFDEKKQHCSNSKMFVQVFMIAKRSGFVLFVVIFVWEKVIIGGGI